MQKSKDLENFKNFALSRNQQKKIGLREESNSSPILIYAKTKNNLINDSNPIYLSQDSDCIWDDEHKGM